MNESPRGLTNANGSIVGQNVGLGGSRLWALAAQSHHMLPVAAGDHETPAGDQCQQRSPRQQPVCLADRGRGRSCQLGRGCCGSAVMHLHMCTCPRAACPPCVEIPKNNTQQYTFACSVLHW